MKMRSAQRGVSTRQRPIRLYKIGQQWVVDVHRWLDCAEPIARYLVTSWSHGMSLVGNAQGLIA